jgi:hypothetical protein
VPADADPDAFSIAHPDAVSVTQPHAFSDADADGNSYPLAHADPRRRRWSRFAEPPRHRIRWVGEAGTTPPAPEVRAL